MERYQPEVWERVSAIIEARRAQEAEELLETWDEESCDIESQLAHDLQRDLEQEQEDRLWHSAWLQANPWACDSD